jgi:hypothetical protein
MRADRLGQHVIAVRAYLLASGFTGRQGLRIPL